MSLNACKARSYGDQMVCSDCGLAWDKSDEDRPKCKPEPIRCSECNVMLKAFEINWFMDHPKDRPVMCAPCYRKRK